MCLATVYVEADGEREKVMEDVAWMRPEGGGLELVTLLGEGRRFQAAIKSVDLLKGVIVLEGRVSDSPKEGEPA